MGTGRLECVTATGYYNGTAEGDERILYFNGRLANVSILIPYKHNLLTFLGYLLE